MSQFVQLGDPSASIWRRRLATVAWRIQLVMLRWVRALIRFQFWMHKVDPVLRAGFDLQMLILFPPDKTEDAAPPDADASTDAEAEVETGEQVFYHYDSKATRSKN